MTQLNHDAWLNAWQHLTPFISCAGATKCRQKAPIYVYTAKGQWTIGCTKLTTPCKEIWVLQFISCLAQQSIISVTQSQHQYVALAFFTDTMLQCIDVELNCISTAARNACIKVSVSSARRVLLTASVVLVAHGISPVSSQSESSITATFNLHCNVYRLRRLYEKQTKHSFIY